MAGRIAWQAEMRPTASAEATGTLDFGPPDALQPVGRAALTAPGAWTAEARVPQRDGRPAETGERMAVATVSVAGATVYRAVIPMRVAPPLDVTVRRFLLRSDKVQVALDASVLASREKVSGVRAAVVDATGKEVAATDGALDAASKAELWVDVKGLAPGGYHLAVSAAGPSGKMLASETRPLVIPPKPAWLGNREGLSDEVLAPWTPLKVAGGSVMPWGRTYTWGALPFPGQVETAGADVLAGPMRLVAVVDGQEQVWSGRGPTFTKRTPARVELTTTAESPAARLTAALWCEYDGCVKCDWQLAAKRPGARLERLAFEIPVKAEHAKYIYHFPGAWASAFNAHALAKDETLGFRPYIWLGDEDRGLAWFCPSDEVFRPANPDAVTEIRREGDQVVLRISLVQEPVALDRPLACTFGFEATPIRHNEKTVWDYRVIHSGTYGLDTQEWSATASIRWPAKGNLRVEAGTVEAWVRPQFDPQVAVAADDSGRGRYNRDFLWLNYAGNQVGFYWNIDDRGMRVFLRTADGQYPVILGAHSDWKKGEWHHIAFTWGDAIRIYVDGKQAAEAKWAGLLPGDLTGANLDLGVGQCEFDVDDLCISDVAREPRGQLGPLAPDEHTLLLESFDAVAGPAGGVVMTAPEKAVGGAGRLSGAVAATDGHFGKAAAIGTPGPRKYLALDYYKDLGVRTICFHEHWASIQNYFAPENPKGLHSLVDACHRRGIGLLVYYGYELSNIAPEWDTYGDEALVYPRAGGYHRLPEQNDYICCYRSAWQDYVAWAIAQTMDKYDMDGVYLDGTSQPWGCENLGHGCGYIGRDGALHPTYDFFAAREMMKRIYTIVKTRKPGGQVNLHQSTNMCIPSIGWATSTWDGEQFGGLPRSEENWPLKVLPLDTFRAEFMGRQWGVPAELLCYGQPYTYEEAMAISLLHDVLVRPGNAELASKLWLAAEKFGRRQATWLPYWANRRYVRADAADVYCSIYSRGKAGALAVVSNLGHQAAQTSVAFDLAALGLPAKVTVEDVVDEAPVKADGGKVALRLGSLGFKVLWLKPGR
jgi:hypothetical protein